MMTYVMTDWLIIASDIILDGGVVLPAAGDRITESSGDVYEVLPIGGEPEFDYSSHNTLRIHTKRVTAG